MHTVVIFSTVNAMPEQQLPEYTTAFKNAPWEKRESSHYLFHYVKDSLAEKEIEHIAQTQENAYKKIAAFLTLPSYSEKKISYYLYPDADKKKLLMGNSWFAQSVYDEFSIHALYNEQDRVIGPHEDTHLLSLSLGLSIGFLQEGLAEYMVVHDWCGNSFLEVARETLLDKKFTFSPELLTCHQAWLDTDDAHARQYYSLAALFTEFLIETYGKKKYFDLYACLKRKSSQSENEICYLKIFNISSQDLFDTFLQKIGTVTIMSHKTRD